MRKVFLIPLLLSALISPAGLAAQARDTSRLLARIEKPIAVDGILNDPAWKRAREANDLVTIHTFGADASPFKTSIKVLFDGATLYIGIVGLDPNRDQIIIHGTDRDADLRTDDSFYVLIDPRLGDGLYDLFAVNPWGVQAEGQVTKDGRDSVPGWNVAWQAAAQTVEVGWTAEMAIPLKSLSPDKPLPAIGVLFGRVVPRVSRSFWSGPLDPAFETADLSKFITLDLLRGGAASSARASFLGFAGPDRGRALPGLEASREFSPALNVSLALQPDFETVEPDDEIFNLTRFEIRYPERRAFLQDPGGFLDTPLSLFYSKRVNDIWGGVRLSGTAGGFEYEAFDAQSKPYESQFIQASNFSVVRVRKAVGPLSIGVMDVNQVTGGSTLGAAGVDFSLAVGKPWLVSGQAALAYGLAGQTASAFFLGSAWNFPLFRAHLSLAFLDKTFADIADGFGFIPDDDRREVSAGLEKTFSFPKGKVDKLHLGLEGDIYWNHAGDLLRGWSLSPYVTMDIGETFAISISDAEEFRLFEKKYQNRRTQLSVILNRDEQWQKASLSFSIGRLFGGQFSMFDIEKWIVVSTSARMIFHISYLLYSTEAALNPYIPFTTGWTVDLKLYYDFSPDLTMSFLCHFGSRDGFIDLQPRTTLTRQYFQLMAQLRVLPPYGMVQAGYQKAAYQFDLDRPNLLQNGAFLRLNAIF